MPDVDELDEWADDEAAEPDDDEPDADAVRDGDDGDPDDSHLFSGVCVGGPWDGRTVTARFPAGFLLIDKRQSVVWIYDRTDGQYHARTDGPYPLDHAKRWAAAEGPDYDIRVPDGDEAVSA